MNELKNVIEQLKLKLSDIENRNDHDEDYDYYSGLEDGLTIAINVLEQAA